MYCGNTNPAELARLEKMIQDHERKSARRMLEQDSKIADIRRANDASMYSAFTDYLRYMQNSGALAKVITDTLLNDVAVMDHRTKHIVSVKEFGACGNGVCDDTEAIQNAIDAANEFGRVVHLPAGVYYITKPLVLNGCSIVGSVGNVFKAAGTVIKCATADFTAIKQGSTASADIMFNLSDIVVDGAAVGFEIVYAINSKYERLYAVNCGTGFKIGDPSAVGCMFCEFNNLYTSGCENGVVIDSDEYMNNNRFNNGFVQAEQHAMKMNVSGGYGAVGNVFNNVEFRSSNGRGISLSACVNTVFNSCYFECGAAAIVLENYCSVTLNNGTFGSFKILNAYNDVSMFRALGGGQITVNGGIVFLTEEYDNAVFFGFDNAAVHQNVTVVKNMLKNGNASGFKFFAQAVARHEQTSLTGTVNVPADGSVEVPFTYETPFASVPKIVTATMRGAAGAERGLAFAFSERTESGGKLSVTNTSTGARSVSFSIYAKSDV